MSIFIPLKPVHEWSKKFHCHTFLTESVSQVTHQNLDGHEGSRGEHVFQMLKD